MKFTGKKLFIWFTTLALILACVPSAVTPVPPLDPNAINTTIAQRANAASTQTQAAIPPTLTFTPTPRSTFTVEPTSTLVPFIDFPTPTPIKGKQYFRVKHDSQLAKYHYKSRTAAPDWIGVDLFTPEVVPMYEVQIAGSGTHRTILNGAWEAYIDALNGGDKQKLRYLKADDTALFDHKGFPHLESLTMGGNVVTIVELKGGWGRVNTVALEDLNALKAYDYMSRPDLINKFVVVAWNKATSSTYWVNPPPGEIYWPLVSNQECWISLERLEPFPTLPAVVIANIEQKVLETPEVKGKETGSVFQVGESGRIVEYFPSGSNVWGRLSYGGWIALLLNHKYPTDWKMETAPPP